MKDSKLTKKEEELGREALKKLDEATTEMTDTLKKARAEGRQLTRAEKDKINHLNAEVSLNDYLVPNHIFKRKKIVPRRVDKL